jgi:hypothetical protein
MPVYPIARLKIQNDAPEPIIEANDALGGLHIVDTEIERAAIPDYVKGSWTWCWVAASSRLYQWNATGNTWDDVSVSMGGIPVQMKGGTAGQVLGLVDIGKGVLNIEPISTSSVVSFAGDLSGSSTSQEVVGLAEVPLTMASLAAGDLLSYTVTPTPAWGNLPAASLSLSGDVTGTLGASTVTKVNGASVPTVGSGDVGKALFASAKNAYGLSALSGDVTPYGSVGGVKVIQIQGKPWSSNAPTAGQVPNWDFTGGAWTPVSYGGDVTGTPSSAIVSGLKGAAVDAPSASGQVPVYNKTNNIYTHTNVVTGINDGATTYVDQTFQLKPGTNISIAWSELSGVVTATITGVQTMPTEIVLCSGKFLISNVGTFAIALKAIDFTKYPAVMGTLNRIVKLVTVLEVEGAGTAQLALYDFTNSVSITNASVTLATPGTPTSLTSSAIPVGSDSGDLRNDVTALYEVQFILYGTVNDAAACYNAALVVSYS